MNDYQEVLRILGDLLRTVGRLEGEFVEFRKLSERVSKLEMWQAWLKGGWTALAAACVWLSKGIRFN